VEDWLPWIWLILAIVFTVAEIFTAGFFLICFGAGAAIASVAAFFGFGALIQIIAFAVGSSVALVLLRPFALRVSGDQTNTVGIDRVIGRHAVVLESIDPAKGRGLVRMGSERWSAESADNIPIAAGVTVEVIGVDGAHLKVRALAAG